MKSGAHKAGSMQAVLAAAEVDYHTAADWYKGPRFDQCVKYQEFYHCMNRL